MLCASRLGQSPLSCSRHFIMLPLQPVLRDELGNAVGPCGGTSCIRRGARGACPRYQRRSPLCDRQVSHMKSGSLLFRTREGQQNSNRQHQQHAEKHAQKDRHNAVHCVPPTCVHGAYTAARPIFPFELPSSRTKCARLMPCPPMTLITAQSRKGTFCDIDPRAADGSVLE